jgi:hypothetical protein
MLKKSGCLGQTEGNGQNVLSILFDFKSYLNDLELMWKLEKNNCDQNLQLIEP